MDANIEPKPFKTPKDELRVLGGFRFSRHDDGIITTTISWLGYTLTIRQYGWWHWRQRRWWPVRFVNSRPPHEVWWLIGSFAIRLERFGYG